MYKNAMMAFLRVTRSPTTQQMGLFHQPVNDNYKKFSCFNGRMLEIMSNMKIDDIIRSKWLLAALLILGLLYFEGRIQNKILKKETTDAFSVQ